MGPADVVGYAHVAHDAAKLDVVADMEAVRVEPRDFDSLDDNLDRASGLIRDKLSVRPSRRRLCGVIGMKKADRDEDAKNNSRTKTTHQNPSLLDN
jgi:hypothetical protein